MPQSAESVHQRVCQHVRETALLSSTGSVLEWDERTKMPEVAGAYRAEQTTMISGMVHQRWTDPQLVADLSELAEGPLAADPGGDAAVTIRRLKRHVEKQIKLPRSLVEELSRTSVLGQQAWGQARRQKDFKLFQPLLERTIELKRQQAEALGYPEAPYDALLDDYEPETLTSEVRRVLADLREQLVPLVAAIRQSARRPDLTILQREFPAAVQEELGLEAARAIGFDFHRGRLDVTTHPFCSTLGPDDCRITTRYDEHFFNAAFFGILHEAGHGLYEQGLPTEWFGLPLGEAVSLGIHESQSRLWENLVGRSRAFWEFFFDRARQRFPAALGGVPLDDFYFAINDVRPSLVRVEADEATYNLHILIRFELEQALLEDNLPVADLPGAWNEKYQQYLGVRPADDLLGVLQDIHWSGGLVGYFPTYTLGNLYAAQFFAEADAQLGGLASQFARGQFQPLREWLRENIHRYGRRYTAAELVRQVTGRPLGSGPLMAHLRAKLGPLYGI
ncbi:MAG: carboxypeptidase M32 [Thermoguttaceae bacterium]|jgi:carboxypeptidase Taq